MIDDRIDAVKAWLRREDGRLGDIFGLWTQGKRDDGWVADRLVTEGHLAALIEDAAPQPDTASLVAPITVSYLYAMLAHIEAIHPVEGICNGQGECVTKYGMPAAPQPDTASPDVRGALARAWKRRAKMYKGLWSKQLREFHDWRTALRAAGISEMVDMNPDTVRLTVTVPREKRINEMVEERIAASKAPTPLAPHPGQNHDYRMTCLRCGEPGYLFVGFHSPGETYRWSEAMPKEAE